MLGRGRENRAGDHSHCSAPGFAARAGKYLKQSFASKKGCLYYVKMYICICGGSFTVIYLLFEKCSKCEFGILKRTYSNGEHLPAPEVKECVLTLAEVIKAHCHTLFMALQHLGALVMD